MHLRRIDIFGFKSFADKIELEFGPGITSIVGPNGSGKSNVSDAIRWVLGEQSPRQLRGSKMEDIIFAGSASRKSVSLAEVSLTLDNADGVLPVDFSEVTVTRRIDRAGESEYLMNKVQCRLRDIQDLFMDTGVGKEAYSVISQGRIDEILSNRPEDRRAVFEEAAGIIRYKTRKREATRKLEETTQNLLRIGDVIGELEGQVGQLEDQARRAELYQEYHGEMEKLEVGLLGSSIRSFREKIILQQEKNEALRETVTQTAESVQRLEQELEQTQTARAVQEAEAIEVSAELLHASTQLERAQARVGMTEEMIARALEDEGSLGGEIRYLEDKLRTLGHERQRIEQKLGSLAEAIRQAQEQLRNKEETQTLAAGTASRDEQHLEERKAEAIDLLKRMSDKRNLATAGQKTQEEGQKRLERIEAERQRALRSEREARELIAGCESRVDALERERLGAEVRLANDRIRREELDRQMGQASEVLSRARAELQSAASRLGLLEEMRREHEGYQKGVKTILQGKESGAPYARGMIGVIAELIKVDARYERAIETALGAGLQNLVAETDRDAQRAIEYLKARDGGRATFLPLNTIQPQTIRTDELKNLTGIDGFLGVAVDLIHFAENLLPAMASLLGRTIVAGNLDAALNLGRRSGFRHRIVTLDGELLNPGGSITGGSLGTRATGLLGREREREDLTEKVKGLRTQVETLEQDLTRLRGDRAAVDSTILQTQKEIQALEIQLAEARSELLRFRSEKERLDQALELFQSEKKTLLEELAGGEQVCQQVLGEVEELELRAAALEGEIALEQARFKERQAQKDVLAQEITGLRVQLASCRQEETGLREQLIRLGSQVNEINGSIRVKTGEKEKIRARQEELEREAKELSVEARQLAAARESLDDRLQAIQARGQEARARQSDREREARGIRRNLTDSQSKLANGEVEEARLRMEEENLASRLQEQYGASPETAMERDLPPDLAAWAPARVADLRERIRSLGPVSLAAIKDYRQVSERYHFLQKQKLDLEQARESLYRAIDEMDRRIRTHFLESFRAIRAEFQKVFAELFEGGRADLTLMDEENLLDTGIEIIAQPPGKKLQVLSLLSGGERALTAIALLFAILKVRPTPFCILDEVDAALDEANVERFARYLKVFGQQTQFIVITHQRGTMEVSNCLYGVTMEEQGVSKLVSVRLAEARREAG